MCVQYTCMYVECINAVYVYLNSYSLIIYSVFIFVKLYKIFQTGWQCRSTQYNIKSCENERENVFLFLFFFFFIISILLKFKLLIFVLYIIHIHSSFPPTYTF